MVCLLSAGAMAQLPDGTPAPAQPQDIDRIRELVQAGALPRNRLAEAEDALADARDNEILKRTLYGSLTVQELTEEQCDEMLAAAKRMYDRQLEIVQHAQTLVDVGAKARTSAVADLEELDFRHRTLDLAESRASLLKELSELAKAEHSEESEGAAGGPISVRYDGNGIFRQAQFVRIELSFLHRFGHQLPISAYGMTPIHKALGFDHRDRVDVAISPDQPEGRWLRSYLESQKIPYFAFRTAVRGKATAPHIHIGPPSGRLRVAD